MKRILIMMLTMSIFWNQQGNVGLANGDHRNSAPLLRSAIENGSLNDAQKYIAPDNINWQDLAGNTHLHILVQFPETRENIRLVQLLLEYDIRVDAPNRKGITVADILAKKAHFGYEQVLFSKHPELQIVVEEKRDAVTRTVIAGLQKNDLPASARFKGMLKRQSIAPKELVRNSKISTMGSLALGMIGAYALIQLYGHFFKPKEVDKKDKPEKIKKENQSE